MTFREMTVEDLEQVVEIENRLFSDPWTKEGFFTFLTKENTMFFVIEEKEKILAYCSMQTVLDEGDILNVAVSPDRQREGIGYFLVDSMLKMAEMIGTISYILKCGKIMGRPEDCMNVLALKKMVCVKTIIRTLQKMRF